MFRPGSGGTGMRCHGRPSKILACQSTLQPLQDVKLTWRKQLYKKFFENAPSAQDFLKQSTGRLHFIADRILAAWI